MFEALSQKALRVMTFYLGGEVGMGFLRPCGWVPKQGTPAFGVSAGLGMNLQPFVVENWGSGISSCPCGQHSVSLFDVGRKGGDSSLMKQGGQYDGSFGDNEAISWSKEERE